MSKYSEFQVDGGKTRVQESLESQLADIKNYKNEITFFLYSHPIAKPNTGSSTKRRYY